MNWPNAKGLRENLQRLGEDELFYIKESGLAVRVAYEKREGWLKELPCYIFWCPACENFSYDYPRGTPEERHLSCHRCGGKVDFRTPWEKLKAAILEFWKQTREKK